MASTQSGVPKDVPKTLTNLFWGICTHCSLFAIEVKDIKVYTPNEEEKTWGINKEFLIRDKFQVVQCPKCRDRWYARKLNSRWFAWSVDQAHRQLDIPIPDTPPD